VTSVHGYEQEKGSFALFVNANLQVAHK